MTIEHKDENYLNPNEIFVEEATRVYRYVRDIPFVLGADGGNPDLLITEGVSGCTRKHLFLARRLNEIGYNVSLGIAVFNWRDLPIPQDILALLERPIQYHMFLFVENLTDETEMKIDATWDCKMKPLGFTVNDWDGRTSTPLTVPIKNLWRQNYRVLQARSTVSSSMRQVKDFIYGKQPTPFNRAFNKWVAEMRNR